MAAIYVRMAQDAGFASIIAAAREAQQHAMADETVEMADSATPENWQVVRLRIWARQWRAGKLAPKVYGDRVAQDVQLTVTDGLAARVEAARKRITE